MHRLRPKDLSVLRATLLLLKKAVRASTECWHLGPGRGGQFSRLGRVVLFTSHPRGTNSAWNEFSPQKRGVINSGVISSVSVWSTRSLFQRKDFGPPYCTLTCSFFAQKEWWRLGDNAMGGWGPPIESTGWVNQGGILRPEVHYQAKISQQPLFIGKMVIGDARMPHNASCGKMYSWFNVKSLLGHNHEVWLEKTGFKNLGVWISMLSQYGGRSQLRGRCSFIVEVFFVGFGCFLIMFLVAFLCAFVFNFFWCFPTWPCSCR